MDNHWRLSALFVALALYASPVSAQIPGGGGVQQSGAVVANDCVAWVGNGLIKDAGAACGGAGGSPGGTSGQVQYNNSGAFGGFTASGDATINTGTGAVTLKNTGPGATGPTGSATVVPIVTIDAQGRVTALTSTTITQPAGANPTATASDTAVNGAATTYMRSDGAPAIQKTSSSLFGLAKVDGTTITASAGVISAAPTSAVPSVQSGTNYPIVDGDRAKVIYLSNAAAQTPTMPSAATLTSPNGWFVTICNIAAGIQTVTPTTSTIGGASTLAIPGGSAARPVCWNAVSDGTNYSLVPAGNNNTIASGTSALGTGAITSATCATLVTTSAPGVVTTDVVMASFNANTDAVTGYVPLTSGMLTIKGYPTANNVNFSVCNNTSGSITPGAVTLNWRVER